MAVLLLLVIHFVLAVTSTLSKCTTYDEVAHITAGYTYWQLNDYRLQPENGNLPQRIAALPLVLAGQFRFPDLEQAAWRESNVWALGHQFFYGCGNDLDLLLLLARSMIALLSVCLCLVVYLWSRRIFGGVGGLISLTLCVFSPTVLAHGRLATSDVCNTLFLSLSLWSVWSLLHRVSPARIIFCGLAVAGLFLSKMSAALFLPVAAILLIITLLRQQPLFVTWPGGKERLIRSRVGHAAALGVIVGLVTLMTVVMVWGAYGFRYTAWQGDQSSARFLEYGTLEGVAEKTGGVGRIVSAAGHRRLLPESFLYGFLYVAAEKERAGFLNGKYSTTGWPQFFPYCLLVKTPVPTLILVVLGLVVFVQDRRRGAQHENSAAEPDSQRDVDDWSYHLRPLLVWLAFIWPIFICSSLNIGHRHILPTYPAMFILAGGISLRLHRSRKWALLVGGLLAWLAIETVTSYPHFLAYFNSFVPRKEAYKHLVDSNLDWGQDLPLLRRWLDENAPPSEPVYLGYMGNGDPGYYGIQCHRIPPRDKTSVQHGYQGGIYCVGATWLQAVYFRVRGHWNPDYEQAYQEVRQRVRRLATEAQGDRQTALEDDERSDVLFRYHMLCAARLLAYLRDRTPDDQVGYSILIFRLTDEDVRSALDGPPPEYGATFSALRAGRSRYLADFQNMTWKRPFHRPVQAYHLCESSPGP